VSFTLSGLLTADETMDGHFDSWENVPKLIESITVDNHREPLQQLRQTTRIRLGWPQSLADKKDRKASILTTKQSWEKWWQTTGKKIAELKKQNAKIDKAAFGMAWQFLGTTLKKPEQPMPVWIPSSWTLRVTFTNGDYIGREKELWTIKRTENDVSMTKLRGDYSQGEWGVSIAKHTTLPLKQADRVLKALCYLHQYAPFHADDVTDNSMKTYYPGATLSLHDGNKRLLWNVKGYDFTKTRNKIDQGESGRSYYFLRSIFPSNDSWKNLPKPSSEDLAPYRSFLSYNKPYFCSLAPDVILLFGQRGGASEWQSLINWADKQKATIAPSVEWQDLSDDFGTALKINVVNFTRREFEQTVKTIGKLGKRLNLNPAEITQIQSLEQNVADMLALEKKEKQADIMRHPQPLRDLIIADRHPNDSDLKHLKAAIEQIRKKPDPKLFHQLIAELDDGTTEMVSLLNYILIDAADILELAPWKRKEQATAVKACIDALPTARQMGEMDTLLQVLLRICGGGKIEVADKNGGSSVTVKITKNGYSSSLSGASNPLSMADAQKELNRLYTESQKK